MRPHVGKGSDYASPPSWHSAVLPVVGTSRRPDPDYARASTTRRCFDLCIKAQPWSREAIASSPDSIAAALSPHARCGRACEISDYRHLGRATPTAGRRTAQSRTSRPQATPLHRRMARPTHGTDGLSRRSSRASPRQPCATRAKRDQRRPTHQRKRRSTGQVRRPPALPQVRPRRTRNIHAASYRAEISLSPDRSPTSPRGSPRRWDGRCRTPRDSRMRWSRHESVHTRVSTRREMPVSGPESDDPLVPHRAMPG